MLYWAVSDHMLACLAFRTQAATPMHCARKAVLDGSRPTTPAHDRSSTSKTAAGNTYNFLSTTSAPVPTTTPLLPSSITIM